jgi:hypothetical protein
MSEKVAVKMNTRILSSDVSHMFDELSQCLEHWESIIPIPAHPDLRDPWKYSLTTYVEEICPGQENLVHSVTSGLLEAYSSWNIGLEDHGGKTQVDKIKDLLQRPQTTQRTADWYTEFKRCLTASEIFKLFSSSRERGTLVLQKSGKIELAKRSGTPVSKRADMSPFDWGICFEPVVKLILESEWDCTIHECGRFIHTVDTRLAASPDGLILQSNKFPEMAGHLLEIKCPKSRPIGLKIPLEYYYQIQLQLEVTDIDECEYVEAKFDFTELCLLDKSVKWFGLISLVAIFNEETSDWTPSKYMYGPIKDLQWTPQLASGEKIIETNVWTCDKFHHERVLRNKAWFNSLRPMIESFWNDVEQAKLGNFVLPESSRKRKDKVCLIVDDPDEKSQP